MLVMFLQLAVSLYVFLFYFYGSFQWVSTFTPRLLEK